MKLHHLPSNYQEYPNGATTQKTFEADLASTETTEQLVNDHEMDAFYFRALEKSGIKLNKPQLEAVRHTQGPALVLAGAGSGKTRVLASRTGYLLSVHKVNPNNILLVTFTKKAADEMKDRIANLPGLTPAITRGMIAGTFHSVFLRVIMSQGYTQKLLTSEKQKQVAIKILLKEMGLQDAYEPETLLALLSFYKNNMTRASDLPEKTSVDKEVKQILQKYERWKASRQFIDFDDILLESYFLLRSNPALLKSLQNRFRYILCDEWQDTNPIQYELIKMIAEPENNLFVVGDDDQTIFTFNGAVIKNILDFDKEYPSAKRFTLDINYRSTTSIVGLANKTISYNEGRHVKTLKAVQASEQKPLFMRPSSTDDEARMIIEQIVREVKEGKRRYSDYAILHRTMSNSRAIFEQLVMQKIPFVSYSKGNNFYEQAIVKPVIDYMRLALNPLDQHALEGVLTTLYLNRERVMEYVQMEQLHQPKKKIYKHLLNLPLLKPFQQQQISERLKLIEKLKEMKPVEAIKTIRKFYDKYLEADERKNLTMHKEMLKETLAELESSARKFSNIDEFVAFIDQIIEKNKEMEALQKNHKTDCVSLMTIHRAKGLEFPVVYLIGASETILPHSSSMDADKRSDMILPQDNNKKKIAEAVEEERRLAYVAVTRAKEELYISSPASYRGENVDVSRFFLEPFAAENKSTEKGNKKGERKRQREEALVWDCTSAECNAWVRITTYEEAHLEERNCPLCDSKMVKASRVM
ncbi:UvrD-helicase domain-containing protein [Schinkia sp. CFF1]